MYYFVVETSDEMWGALNKRVLRKVEYSIQHCKYTTIFRNTKNKYY
jgi:hypothetical protein